MLGLLDSVIILISLLLVVGAVLRAAGKKQTDAEYFLAGRDCDGRLSACRCWPRTFRPSTCVGMAGDGYRIGMVTGGYEWMAAWCLIILASLFAPLYLRSRIYTIPEFLERRFGWGLRAFLSGNLLVMNVLTKNAIDLWAGSLLFVLLFGWNQMAVMIVLSIFTALYTMKGGLRAVVYADMVQGTWLIVSSIVLTIVGLCRRWRMARADRACRSLADPYGEAAGFRASHHRLPDREPDGRNVLLVHGPDQRAACPGRALRGSGPERSHLRRLPETAHPFHPGAAWCHRPRALSEPSESRHGVSAPGQGSAARRTSRAGAGRADCDPDVFDERVLQRQRHAGGPRLRHALETRTFRREQVVIGRRVTVLMAVLGVLAAPPLGLSVTIWHYLQMISAYLWVPLGAVIFLGLLWKRGNTAGAIAGGAAGFALACSCSWIRPWAGRCPFSASLSEFVPPPDACGVVVCGGGDDCGEPRDPPPDQEKIEGNVFVASKPAVWDSLTTACGPASCSPAR